MNDQITDRLNETGFPFQKWCLDTIRHAQDSTGRPRYRAVSEWPYTFPPSNGPLLGVHGTTDILAFGSVDSQAGQMLMFLSFECKRARAEIKNWVFVSDKSERRPTFVMAKKPANASENLAIRRDVWFPDLGYHNPEAFDFCNNVIEINDKLSALNRNQEEKVFKAIRQSVHASVALEVTASPRRIGGLTTDVAFEHIAHLIFIPVVVTTAKLYATEFDYKDVLDGDIDPNKIKYTEKEWLTYEFPLPDFLSYTHKDRVIATRTVFVVNAARLTDFLTKVARVVH